MTIGTPIDAGAQSGAAMQVDARASFAEPTFTNPMFTDPMLTDPTLTDPRSPV